MLNTVGQARLLRWLERSGLNRHEFSQLIHADPSTVTKILSGIRRPSFDIAVQIEMETGIPVKAWASRRTDKNRRGEAKHARKTLTGQAV